MDSMDGVSSDHAEVYKQELNRVSNYAHHRVDHILKDMLEQLFIASPADPIDFMIDFLTTFKEKRDEPNTAQTELEPRFSSEPAAPSPVAGYNRGRRRTAVSAEPVDVLSADNNETVVIPKTPVQKSRITDSVRNNILFSSLDSEQLKTVVDAMMEKQFKPGDVIIQQGDPGDFFYVVDSGEAECFVSSGGGPEILVKTYQKGESFGELALMYNSPRAATIKAKTPISLWAMDRVTFRKVLMDTTGAKRKKYEEFLQGVKLLCCLDRYERAKIADTLVEKTFLPGDYVITQGEPGEIFYIIVEGHAKVTKSMEFQQEPVVVMELGPSDYFGELALINDNPRAANVVASTELKTVTLDRGAFTRLLGPIEHILKRNLDAYRSVEKKIFDEAREVDRISDLDEESGSPKLKPVYAGRRRRTAVSSEPVSAMSEHETTHTPVVPKTEEQKARILHSIRKNFLFQGLDADQMNIVLNAMFERKYKNGDIIISQGEAGDNFYVLDDGKAECYVNQPNAEPLLVKTYSHGESFGELALMYNSPRAATIKALGDVRVWAVDRVTFRRVLMNTTSDKRKLYESFLSDVNVLSALDRYERAKVADSLLEKTFKNGEYVIRQGEPGDNFYIVVGGEAVATKQLSSGAEPVEVMRYKRGDYFGELALLNDAPRAANVIAVGDLRVVTLDRDSFVRLLGPCDEILKRNTDTYRNAESSAKSS